jgi:hypothetical protein
MFCTRIPRFIEDGSIRLRPLRVFDSYRGTILSNPRVPACPFELYFVAILISYVILAELGKKIFYKKMGNSK